MSALANITSATSGAIAIRSEESKTVQSMNSNSFQLNLLQTATDASTKSIKSAADTIKEGRLYS
jgi:hypothetical protein